jgi:hypothetical protein
MGKWLFSTFNSATLSCKHCAAMPSDSIPRFSYLRIATITVKYIESQYFKRSALVQIDSESSLNPETRESFR